MSAMNVSSLERVEKLIALAVSPATPTEEARNAAMQACAIIAANDLLRAVSTAASSDKEFWSAVAIAVAGSATSTRASLCAAWADELVDTRRKIFR